MRFFVAGYSMSPCGNVFDAALEGAFLEGLRALPHVAGIELPHYATTGLDRWDESFFFAHADPQWDYVVSTLPALSHALRVNPNHGLAATDEAARQEALAAIRVAQASVRRAHDRLGRRAVRAVEVHSGPSLGRLDGRASAQRFAQSLEEVGGWDWEGVQVVVEHCDAAVAGQPHQKGFLAIEEEVAAIVAANRNLDGPIAGSLNWGRSAIEGRSADIVGSHADTLADAGLLRGAMFSGCSGADTAFGAWQDTHMPHAREPYTVAFAEHSLLNEREVRAILARAHPEGLAFVGLKIAARPLDAPVAQRLQLLRSGLEVLTAAALAPA